MNHARLEILLWFFASPLILILVALSILIHRKRTLRKKAGVAAKRPAASASPPDKRKMALMIEMLRDGGNIDDTSLRRMTAEEKALFEVELIDALTKWPREDQHQLRLALIKHGYDEQCARRVMREEISDRVRASTLLSLLRPQSQARTGDLAQRPKVDSAKLTGSANGEGSTC